MTTNEIQSVKEKFLSLNFLNDDQLSKKQVFVDVY